MSVQIAVFGLGYVGAVSAACLADRGHEVIGVDVNPDKVARLNSGKAPIVEDEIAELTERVVASGALRATTDVLDAVGNTDIALICVGTPSNAAGGLETTYLERVIDNIGAAIVELDAATDGGKEYSIVVRSTCVPGTSDTLLIPRLEAATGRRVGDGLGYATNPEFLREATSVADFHNPPKTVIGEVDSRTADLVAKIYDGLPGPLFRVPVKVAELTKYADNCFHAVKVSFANEIGTLADALDIDSHQVMEIFKADTKLNVSPAYLTPGFAFGGSCLPKDLRAILHLGRHHDLDTPLLSSVLPANEAQIDRAYESILASGARRIGIYGLSFKSGTDDLRESPLVVLAERLLGRGHELMIWDDQVQMSAITGANRAFVDERIPHLHKLMSSSAPAVANHAELVVLGTKKADAVDAVKALPELGVVDLVRVGDAELEGRDGYVGFAW